MVGIVSAIVTGPLGELWLRLQGFRSAYKNEITTKLDTGSNASVSIWQNWETFGKHAPASKVSKNMFRFASAFKATHP